MAWTARPAPRVRIALPRTPASWLGACAVALAVVGLAAPQVFPSEAASALRSDAAAASRADGGDAAEAGPAGNGHQGEAGGRHAASGQAARGPAPALPTGDALAANVKAAAAYAGERDWRTGIAVVDTTTGEVVTAGNMHGMFSAESTVKVMVAARLLAGGRMTGDTQAKATAMITRSDDDAGGELYLATGGDDLIAWASDRYHLAGLGEPPANGKLIWGSTQVSPLGMARFLAAAKADPKVGPWLLRTMGRTEDKAADGTDQVFGLLAVDRSAAVKQGWGSDVPGGDGVIAPSIGFVNGNRYAVAIYTMHLPDAPRDQARAMVTAQARILFGQSPTG
ncbi:MAG: hypothetical protein IPK37_06215 [Austwickia sp.]|jgi:hypothetical protein|nr:MAG: hypothetical protein IPK37_06215 [Austwickia sp.]